LASGPRTTRTVGCSRSNRASARASRASCSAAAGSVTALEAVTGRQLAWATAQYLSYARPPDTADLDVTVPVSGNHCTQARAIGQVGNRDVFTVNASLGRRPLDVQGEWAARAGDVGGKGRASG